LLSYACNWKEYDLLVLCTGAWGMDFVGKKCKKHGGFPNEVSDMARNMKMELLTFSLILYQSKNCGHRIHVLFMMYDVIAFINRYPAKLLVFWEKIIHAQLLNVADDGFS
jgi:hypothetical protein